MLSCSGFKCLGYILQQTSPYFFTKETVRAMDELIYSVANNGIVLARISVF